MATSPLRFALRFYIREGKKGFSALAAANIAASIGICFVKSSRFLAFIIVSSIIASSLSYFYGSSLRAQDREESPIEQPFIIEESSEDRSEDSASVENSSFNVWEGYYNKHFRNQLGISYARNIQGYNSRFFGFGNIAWDDSFEWIDLKVDIEYFLREDRYQLELLPEYKQVLEEERDKLITAEVSPEDERLQDINETLRENEKEAIISDDNFIYRDIYVKLNFDSFDVSVGMHTIVWGQLDILSAADIVLPTRVDAGELSYLKAYSRQPQLSAIFSYFPTERIEILAYYFPELSLSSSARRLYEREREAEVDEIIHDFEFPKGTSKAQYAGRILFYLENLILGFTYYNGWLWLGENPNRQIREVERPNINGENAIYYVIEERPRMERVDSFSFESAVLVDSFTISLESIYFDVSAPLLIFNFPELNSTIYNDLEPTETFTTKRDLARWAIEQNGGHLNVNADIFITTLGIDYDGDNYIGNIGALNATIRPKTKRDEDGVNLQVKQLGADDFDIDDSRTFWLPYIHLGKYLRNDKSFIIGFAFGFFNPSIGLAGYISKEFWETLRISFSIEYLATESALEVIELEEGYIPKDLFGTTARIIAIYKF